MSTDSFDWQPAPDECLLASDAIHVWRGSLDPPQAEWEKFTAMLSEDERVRADRFRFERHRRRFTAGRGMLRTLLGRYLNLSPESLLFQYGPFGKPSLDDCVGAPAMRFNLSHSHEMALLAFTLDREIGVDIEHRRTLENGDRMARRYFSPREVAIYEAVSSAERTQAFFNCWTRKEAYLKACGEGITKPLDQFDVTLIPDAPAQLLQVTTNPGEAEHWSMCTLVPDPEYIAALAVRDHNYRVSCWQF